MLGRNDTSDESIASGAQCTIDGRRGLESSDAGMVKALAGSQWHEVQVEVETGSKAGRRWLLGLFIDDAGGRPESGLVNIVVQFRGVF